MGRNNNVREMAAKQSADDSWNYSRLRLGERTQFIFYQREV
jgi:hypothetical protein